MWNCFRRGRVQSRTKYASKTKFKTWGYQKVAKKKKIQERPAQVEQRQLQTRNPGLCWMIPLPFKVRCKIFLKKEITWNLENNNVSPTCESIWKSWIVWMDELQCFYNVSMELHKLLWKSAKIAKTAISLPLLTEE